MTDEVIVYQSADNAVRLDVQLAEETVWLSQKQMAQLFDTTPQNITLHIGNVYKEQELTQSATCKDFLQVQIEGGQQKQRYTKFYNLDVIISVGYRVKSQRGTQFRQWASRVIKDYMLRGYAINQRLAAVEDRIDRRLQEHTDQIHELQNKVDFFVRTSLPPIEQVFFEGEFFVARVIFEKIVKSATKRVIVIDEYIDAATFEMLDVRAKGVTADIYSNGLHATLRDAHNATAGVEPIQTHKWRNASHDRWIIADDTLYHCGHSLKDTGKKLSCVDLITSISADVVLNYVR